MADSIVLYNRQDCPFCWRVRMALHRCGVDYEMRPHDAPEHKEHWPTLTPNNTVPVLLVDELVIYESAVALEYLNDRYGALWPTDLAERTRARGAASYADSRIGQPVLGVVAARRDKKGAEAIDKAIGEAERKWGEALPFLESSIGGRNEFVDGGGIPDYVLGSWFGLALMHEISLPESGPLADWFQRFSGQDEFWDTAPEKVQKILRP